MLVLLYRLLIDTVNSVVVTVKSQSADKPPLLLRLQALPALERSSSDPPMAWAVPMHRTESSSMETRMALASQSD